MYNYKGALSLSGLLGPCCACWRNTPEAAQARPAGPGWGGSRSDPFSRLETRVRILFFIPAVRRMVVA